ncbi:hypothetical protein [Nocardia sp. CA-120079]|uniref:hypothetical protein n=1 Tax=Nocardia sp. CA-120079 TaxID=3239974 RepID=UPI003D980AB5
MRLIPRALIRAFRPRAQRRAVSPYAPFDEPTPWQLRFDEPPPWRFRMDSDPDPADPCPEHLRALELRRNAINIETLANNPELAYPDCDPNRLPARDYGSEIKEAHQALDAYLIEHRAALSAYPSWALAYELIDSEPGNEDPDSNW